MTYVSSTPLLARSDMSWLTEWRRTLDWGLFGGAFFLIAIGLLMSLAAGPTAAARIGYSDEYFFVFRQVCFAGLGATIMVVVSMLDRTWARRFATLVFIVSLALMFFILVWGHEAKGAQRWLRFAGFSLQPSEMVKPALIVLSGWLLAQRELYPTGPWAIIAFLFYAVTLGLLLLQPDVGQSVLLSAAFVVT
ncbi:MAG TPA: cell division protein FtsW, partial [Hyphomonas sp.]|nr:cell division protein FtsW [Hyphomonas sp.]